MNRRRWLYLGLALLAGILSFAANIRPVPAATLAADVTPQPLRQGTKGEIASGSVLVKFRRSTGASVSSSAISRVGASLKEQLPLAGIAVLNVAPGSEQSTVEALRQFPEVEFAEPNHISSIAAIPNDPYYASYQWSLPVVHAPEAWDRVQGPGPIVGIIDTGLDYGHPDFAGRTLPGIGRIGCGNNAPNGAEDDEGHGTHVAGIIGAASNNGIGVAGIAWTSTILPFKAADAAGNLCDADWIYGLGWLVDHDVRIVNMSFGGAEHSNIAQAAIDDAWSKGVLIVAASGNDYGPWVQYPASYNHVISVGAIGSDNVRSAFSNYNQYVDIVAPGGGNLTVGDSRNYIFSTIWRGSRYASFGGYGLEAGTSQATPHVAGAAALLLSVYPDLSNVELESALLDSAIDLGPTGRDDEYGAGLLNIKAAVDRIIPPGCLFTDVCGSDYFYTPVQYLYNHGAISGYGDNSFRPYNNTTRGQLTKILVVSKEWDIDTTGGPHFSDVSAGSVFYSFIETALNHGVISGYADGTFRPGASVTRGQLSKIIVQAQGWDTDISNSPHFGDVSEANAFYGAIETAYNHGIISGYADDTFRPGASATRGQISKIVYQALNQP